MPKVVLTQEQRRRQRYERRTRVLADGLAAYKRRNRLTNENIAEMTGIGKNTVTRLLCGEDVKMSMMTYWQLLEIAGLDLKQKETEL